MIHLRMCRSACARMENLNLDRCDSQPSLRDSILTQTNTQDCVLGYWQPSLTGLFWRVVGRENRLRMKNKL
jgi:hypothetical protein